MQQQHTFSKGQRVELCGPTDRYTCGCLHADLVITAASPSAKTVSIKQMRFCAVSRASVDASVTLEGVDSPRSSKKALRVSNGV